ncbi:MAG TPA: FliM/FliN family flagellar motor switch protein [Candidatus Obscuribacterales bacterium]
MYQHDPNLDDLLRRPMQMAMNNEDLEDYDDEDEDDLFGADLLAAAQQEREDEEREAADFAASLLGPEEEVPAAAAEAAPEAPPEQPKLFTRPGIRRNLIGYGLLTLFGLIPLVLLFIFWAAAHGLSPVMGLFAFALILGLGFSVYNLVYSFQHGYEFTVSFNIRTFFKLWPECTVISVVLVGISLWNLSQLDGGHALTLSGKSLEAPAAGQAMSDSTGSSMMTDTVEHEEVVYSSFRKAQPRRASAKAWRAPVRRLQGRAHYRLPAKAAKPAAYGKVAASGMTAAHSQPATSHMASQAHPAAAPAAAHNTAMAASHEAGMTTPGMTLMSQPVSQPAAATPVLNQTQRERNARSAAGGAVGSIGARVDVADRANQLFGRPVGGGAVGLVGAMGDKLKVLAQQPKAKRADVLGSDNPMINSFFMGGALCSAFGYALLLGLAGAIFGGLRKFETPFSQKYVEILNIETGEVTSDLRPIAPIMKPLNIVARVLIGLFYGAAVGFGLGLVLVVFLLPFRGALLTPTSPAAMILQSLGMASMPDLAFTNAVTVGGLMIPLVILFVAKMSPQGMSISEELMRQHYEIKPTGKYLPPDLAAAAALGANPAAVSFEITDDELEKELANTKLMHELSQDDDNLTSEIIEEFGREFETVFGIDTRELISQPRGKQTIDRKRLASALDESFGELGNVPVEISAELGSANLPITEWLNLREGTLVLLDKPANEEIDILFNGVRKGKGKLVVADNALAIKVSTTNFQGGNGHGKLV